MELVSWRLENEADRRIGDEIEPDLVRRARCSAGDRAGKAPVDCAVQVAAQDAFDLGWPTTISASRAALSRPKLSM